MRVLTLLLIIIAEIAFSQPIEMKKVQGVWQVPCKINGIPLSFIIDTGAAVVMISKTEATFMLKNGYLEESDILWKESYRIANGEIVDGTRINLKFIEIGGFTIQNVEALVSNSANAPLLFGLTALERFGTVQLDYSQGTLTFIPKEINQSRQKEVSESEANQFKDEISKQWNNVAVWFQQYWVGVTFVVVFLIASYFWFMQGYRGE
ncbi:MAG: retroviral-like aspartic protease family protein [Cyclobacteriaceae bacterium]|nr:retroviral-like aspartic protease family protein [Cyclobacteriaceae bacterium]